MCRNSFVRASRVSDSRSVTPRPKRPPSAIPTSRVLWLAAFAIGWMVTGKTVHTKDGDPMQFVSFEDTTGIYEAVFFSRIYHECCHMLSPMRPYILKGKVEEDFGSLSLSVQGIQFLDR